MIHNCVVLSTTWMVCRTNSRPPPAGWPPPAPNTTPPPPKPAPPPATRPPPAPPKPASPPPCASTAPPSENGSENSAILMQRALHRLGGYATTDTPTPRHTRMSLQCTPRRAMVTLRAHPYLRRSHRHQRSLPHPRRRQSHHHPLGPNRPPHRRPQTPRPQRPLPVPPRRHRNPRQTKGRLMTIADDFTADLTHLQQLADTILDTLDTDTNPPVPLVET